MKTNCKSGDVVEFIHRVSSSDFARFHGEVVHQVYSTFAMARDMEWTTRQFVLQMREDDEEGVGTFVHVDHKSPAFEGEEILFKGIIETLNGNDLRCSVTASVGDRIIGEGRTGQKILKRKKLEQLFLRPS